MHLPRALIIREPEKLIFPERTAGRIAKLISPQFGLALSKVILGIQLIVAQEFENVPVKAVGTRLGDGIDDRTAEFSVFRIKTVRNQSEFLDGVQVGNQPCAEVASLADVSTVHQVRVRRFTLAIHGDVAGIQNARYRTVLLDRFGGARRDAGLQAQKVDEAATVQRQRQYFLGVNDVTQLRALGLHLHRVRHDFYLFRHTANIERYIVVQLVIYFYFDTSLGERPESGGRDRKLIGSSRER